MAITLNNKTRLTAEIEKLLIEAGGYDPERTLSKEELSTALVNAINRLAAQRSPFLLRLYRHCKKNGTLPKITVSD